MLAFPLERQKTTSLMFFRPFTNDLRSALKCVYGRTRCILSVCLCLFKHSFSIDDVLLARLQQT